MFFYDPFYLLFMVPAFLLVFIAQVRVSRAYSKWGRVPNSRSMTGADAATRLLAYGGLGDVRLEGTRGQLTDHYDPRSNTLRLSAGVAQAPSVAALAISAHEIGHALQDREGYYPLRLRAALVPAANIGSYLGWILIMLGLFLRMVPIAWLGVGAFGLGAVFALATLPVEFNASSRARRLLVESGLVASDEETRGVNAVLDAAALTYVAALATAVLQLLYYVLLIGGLGRRRN
ncbi:MAG TPA: zinc metallopeptidase [Anaerolineales bacterium]|nr:zinc metallopeptidase [Anaerolineales bacterium]